jgi:predicted CXXCH cytochrome family protein
VYGFVMATYAGGGEIVNMSANEVRRILATHPAVAPDAGGLLLAEQVVRTKCTLCHEVARSEGKLAVTPPTMRQQWLSHTTFTHTPHRAIDCTQCHAKAVSSTLTSDRLLPQRSACLGCHGGRAGREISPCVTCHEYHERSNRVSLDVADSRRGRPARVQ